MRFSIHDEKGSKSGLLKTFGPILGFYTKVPILKEVNFRKMQLCRVEHMLNTFSTYLSSKLHSKLCNQYIEEGESNIYDKYIE